MKAAREKLLFTKMSREEQIAFCRYIDDRVLISSQIYTAHGEGMLEGMEKGLKRGLEKGLEQGRTEALLNVARNLKENGLSTDVIAKSTGMTIDDIEKL